MDRAPGLSVRLKLTFSYAGFLMIAGGLLLGAVWVFLLRYVPRGETVLVHGTSVFYIARPWRSLARFRSSRCHRARVPPGNRPPRGMASRRPGARPPHSHHRRHPHRRNRIALSSNRAAGGSDEFRELADAFDTMLARLEAHVAQQQRFATNASHELRTPLAIMQTLLDVARDDPSREKSELDERLRAVNARAIALTEALLLLSRTHQQSFTPVPVDLSLIAEEATETLLPFAEKHGVTIETSGDMTPAIGSEALLLQLTTNLVHNAIVHNLPQQGTVWLKTSVQPKTVTLKVENTGERLTSQTVSTLVEPFQRGTERIHTDHAGVGLGLAIVKSITQAHDGTLTLTPRPAGGLCVTVQLPAAPIAR